MTAIADTAPVDTVIGPVRLDGRAVEIAVQAGRVARITPVEGAAGQVALPLAVDPHVHLDKTFTAHRCPRAGAGLFAAIDAMVADLPNWTEADLRARMTRGLQEAHANGITALRSHIDWGGAEVPLGWSVLGELAEDWRGRVEIQRAALTTIEELGDRGIGPRIARDVAQSGGVLGSFVYRQDHLEERLGRVFHLAAAHNLLLDFHVDEGLDPEATGFDIIVDLTRRFGMGGRVMCGHVCSLSIRPHDEAARVIDAAGAAGVAVTVLPTTNLMLQDGGPGETPRRRGLAPLHELRAAGVDVLLGADNVADPFFRGGCYDALDVLRLASVAAHLDPAEWLGAITTGPARAMGLPEPRIAVDAPADFILVDGADLEDALRNPRAARTIFRDGVAISSTKDPL